jgi:hypothetical protein
MNKDIIMAGESSEESTIYLQQRKDEKVSISIKDYMEEMSKKSYVFKETI